MGVNDLWKRCVPGIKSKDPQHFSSIANARIAVDVSCFLRAFVSRPKSALAACCVPPCPLIDVATSLESHHSKFKELNIDE